MKENHYSQEASIHQELYERSIDQIALRAIAISVYESEWSTIDLSSLVQHQNFHPISIANALVKLINLKIINIEANQVHKNKEAVRLILANRNQLLRLKKHTFWKDHDCRKFESTRFKLAALNA